MAKFSPDYTFVRDGEPLAVWLGRLLNEDATIRRRAGDVLHAMSWGVPDIRTDLAEIEPFPDLASQQARFADAVKKTVAEMPDPGDYGHRLTAYLIATHRVFQAELQAESDAEDARGDKFEAKARRHADVIASGAGPIEKARAEVRLARLISVYACGACKRLPSADSEAISHAGQMARQIFEAMGDLHLKTPEVLNGLLDEEFKRSTALTVLTTIGPPAVAFAPRLLREIETRPFMNVRNDTPRALGSIARGSPKVIDKLICLLQSIEDDLADAAANALFAAADDLCNRDKMILEILEARFARNYSTLELFARVGRDDPVVRARVIALAENRPPRMIKWDGAPGFTYESDAVMWERGTAMTAMRHFSNYSVECLPVLISALDDFEEFDPDHSYNGPKERIAHVLEAFGPAGADAAVPLARHLDDPDQDYPKAILNALAAMGPAAKDAVPLIEAFRRTSFEDESPPNLETKIADQFEDHAGWAIQKIRGR